MVTDDILKNYASTCFNQLKADGLIEPTHEWGLDNVWKLNLGSNSAAIRGYAADKMYYQDRITEKKTICLHFTAGWGNKEGFDYLAKTRYNNDIIKLKNKQIEKVYTHCTPFWINTDGKIYQYYHPDYWADNSSINTATHKSNIGIEIVNIGPLRENESDPNTLITEYGNNYCTKNDTGLFYDLGSELRYQYPEYRNRRYFARFTDEQYISLRNLLHVLCTRYEIEYTFLPAKIRFQHASNHEFLKSGYFMKGTTLNAAGKEIDYYYPDQSFNGIFSHVNSDLDKYDIGPAFEWDRITQPPLCYPFEAGKTSTPTTLWYHNTELQREGGYFPIGRNQSVHPGVHLFSSSGTQAIRAIAPGHVAAWRFYTRLENYALGKAREPLKMRHTKPGSFVLLRHDFKIKEGEKETAHVFYSLYMDMEAGSGEIPWINKLKDMATGNEISTGYEDAGALLSPPQDTGRNSRICTRPRQEFAALKFDGDKAVEVEVNGEVQPGKVATLSDAVIPIEAGEIIGYTTRKAGDQASNYFHWEVFSAEDNLFEDLAKKCGIEGFDFSVLDLAGKDGVLGKDEAASLLGVQEITSYQGQWRVGGTAFRDYLADNFVRKPGTYAFSLVCRPPGNIRIRRGLTAGISAWCGKRKLKISVSDNQITITEPDKSGEGNTVLESFSSLCEKEYSVIGCKTLDRLSIEPPGGLTLDYYAEEGRELFVEQASIPGLFRNYSLSTS